MNRFFIPSEWIEGKRVSLHDPYAHQMCHVLRLRPGDWVVVLDNCGREFDVCLTDVGKQLVVGEVRGERVCVAEPKTQVVLFQSMLKRDKFEWVLQKCTEVGVTRIVPVITQRSIVQKISIKSEKRERWQTIVREAAEQCGRGRVPELADPVTLKQSLSVSLDLRIMASLDGEPVSLHEVMSKANSATGSKIGIWIGPEGGFHPEEVALAEEAGAACVRFGQRVLRTETAAVVASSLILHELKEL